MTREEVIQILKILKEDYWDDDGYGHETKKYNDTMLALDMAINAVEQEPKTGHWIRQTDDYHDYYECEHCGIAVGLDDIKNFCPNCGYAMFEPQESEVSDADSN